ncbi:MAG TPA: hypothetical protein VIJ35_11980, partial [Bradyrhizobium sp.]
LANDEAKYFFERIWTGQISLIRLGNYRFTRNAVERQSDVRKCPTGQISTAKSRSDATPLSPLSDRNVDRKRSKQPCYSASSLARFPLVS